MTEKYYKNVFKSMRVFLASRVPEIPWYVDVDDNTVPETVEKFGMIKTRASGTGISYYSTSFANINIFSKDSEDLISLIAKMYVALRNTSSIDIKNYEDETYETIDKMEILSETMTDDSIGKTENYHQHNFGIFYNIRKW